MFTLSIYDVSGRLVLQGSLQAEKSQFDVKNYAKGVYMIEIQSPTDSYKQRLIVQ
jgi:hypothetical protein